jgi:hypothetical protein
MSRGTPDEDTARHLETDCDSFARVAKQFLDNRGLKAQLWGALECAPGYRCIAFKSAPPRSADGKPLSRDDVVRDYLKEPAKADFRWKNLGHGYWAVPDRNFTMGASLHLKAESMGCYAKLMMGFGIVGTEFLGIIPYDHPRSWPVPPDNGRLQNEYMTAIVKELSRKDAR